MTAPKTDRRILRTRALLRQGLAELMQEKNAGDITVKELVAHATVPPFTCTTPTLTRCWLP